MKSIPQGLKPRSYLARTARLESSALSRLEVVALHSE